MRIRTEAAAREMVLHGAPVRIVDPILILYRNSIGVIERSGCPKIQSTSGLDTHSGQTFRETEVSSPLEERYKLEGNKKNGKRTERNQRAFVSLDEQLNE